MSWILLLVLAYFCISLMALADKFIVSQALSEPIVYAFYVSVLGLAAVILIPFGFGYFGSYQLMLSLVAGAGYTLALLGLYQALKTSEASRVYTTAGAIGAVLTFLFSYLFLNERLNSSQVFGFGLLLAGAILIGIEFQKKVGQSGLAYSMLAALSFGVSYTATKAVYLGQPFTSGFIWIRIFAFLTIIVLLFSKRNRLLVSQSFKNKSPIRKRSNQLILLGGQLFSGIGFLIINYVISLTSAAIVLAAQGLQYAFLIILTFIISKKFPQILKEKTTPAIIGQKILAIIIIGTGLVILAKNTI